MHQKDPTKMLSQSRARAAVAYLLRRASATPTAQRHLATVCQVALASHGAEQASNARHDYKAFMAVACVTAGTAAVAFENNKKAECCGISGVVATKSYDARYVCC